jgi:hypothetical protein
MSVELWIDEVTKLFDGIRIANKSIRSFRIYEKDEFPEAIKGDEIPCALTYTAEVECEYSTGPCFEIWKGKTEIHWTPNVDKSKYPEIMLLFKQIRNAFALHRTLGGKVAFIQLAIENTPSIQGPVVFSYGDEVQHLGLLVHWVVKEHVESEITLGN